MTKRESGNDGGENGAAAFATLWIPAFAGMTQERAGMAGKIGGDGALTVHFSLMPTYPSHPNLGMNRER